MSPSVPDVDDFFGISEEFVASLESVDRNLDQNSPNLPIWEQFVPLTDRNSEENSPNLPIWEQCVPFTDRNSEQNSPNLSI